MLIFLKKPWLFSLHLFLSEELGSPLLPRMAVVLSGRLWCLLSSRTLSSEFSADLSAFTQIFQLFGTDSLVFSTSPWAFGTDPLAA